jgi:hypothetical protein
MGLLLQAHPAIGDSIMCVMWHGQSRKRYQSIVAGRARELRVSLNSRPDRIRITSSQENKMDFAQELSQIANFMVLAPFGALGIAALLTVWFMVIIQSVGR